MNKIAALAGVAAVALTPAVASAKPHAKTYKGTFELVGADGSYTSDTFGKAQLVDGRRNDQLSVHVRKLGARAKYVFRLQSASTACKQGAPGGTDVAGWRYRRGGLLVTSRKGVANSSARSTRFAVDRSVEYYVGVFTRTASGAPDQLVACAQLTKRKKSSKGAGKPVSGHSHPGRSEGRTDDHAKPADNGEDHGKSGGDHGKSGEDHGKSDAAPGQGRKARGSRR